MANGGIKHNYAVIDSASVKLGIHSHKVHEMYFLESGEVTYFVGNKIIPLKAGELLFVPKGTLHYTSYENNFPVYRHTLYISDEEIFPELSQYIEKLTEEPHIIIPSDKLYHISGIFKKFQQEERRPYEDKGLMYKLLFSQLVIMLARYRKTDKSTVIPPLQRTIQDVARFIESNITADLRLEALARKFSISPSHLSKQFKILTGTGLNEYVNICRVNVGESLLLETDLTVTEVAFKCGFNDSNYFTRVFKKIKGVTPKAYSMQK